MVFSPIKIYCFKTNKSLYEEEDVLIVFARLLTKHIIALVLVSEKWLLLNINLKVRRKRIIPLQSVFRLNTIYCDLKCYDI